MALPHFKKPAKKRSRNMRAIRSSGNRTTERRLASLLKEQNIRGWRTQPQNILGRPDFLIGKRRVAIFVDGCFFHGCPDCGHIPRTNKAYWTAKITRNKQRDVDVSKALSKLGYCVVRIWECQLRKNPAQCLARILRGQRKRQPRSQARKSKPSRGRIP